MLSHLIFDLDETIYPRDSGLMQAISERISLYMIDRLGMDPAIVPELRREYWSKYGTTSRGLQLFNDIDVNDYMTFVHDLPLSEYVQPNPDLDAALLRLPQTKVVFTNATVQHAESVLDIVGVRRHFEVILDSLFCENEAKPAVAAYRRVVDYLGVSATSCAMIEDAARNLRPAKSLGIATVLVNPPPGADVEGADYIIERISDIGDLVLSLSHT